MKRLSESGFTLMELALVVAIITAIAAGGVPIYQSLQNTNGLDVTINTVVQDLYQAQIFSRDEQHNSSWGVAINGQTVTLYAGTSYVTRNSSYDSVFTMPVTINTSGITEVDFSKLYGLPGTTGVFTLKGSNITRTITINSKGMVDY